MGTSARADHLNQDFAPLITPSEFREWQLDRWAGLKLAIPLAASLATHGRADLLGKVRALSETTVNDEGKDGLVTMLQTVEDVIEFCKAQAEILEAVQARLMLVTDDLLLEHGHSSVLAEADQPFDAVDWIERATEAGATMFVRDDELWIGAVASPGRSPAVDKLKAELDDEARTAVRDVLASRGLVCLEG